jgi:hypothetical protein
MGYFNLQDRNNREHLYTESNIAEAHWLMGTACKFYPCKSYTRDLASDPHPEYDEPVDINIVFDDDPKTTLEKMNWLAEGEDLPFMAYISSIIYPKYKEWKQQLRNTELSDEERSLLLNNHTSFTLMVNKYSLIELPYVMQEQGTKMLMVTDLRGDTVNPLAWYCKLVPYRAQTDIDPTTPEIDDNLGKSDDTDFNYVTPPEEPPINEEYSSGFGYLNVGD